MSNHHFKRYFKYIIYNKLMFYLKKLKSILNFHHFLINISYKLIKIKYIILIYI